MRPLSSQKASTGVGTFQIFDRLGAPEDMLLASEIPRLLAAYSALFHTRKLPKE